MTFSFDAKQLQDFETNIYKEWALTNGLGGYAGGSILGAQNRTHQGYLIASLHPPVERFVVFSKTCERFVQKSTLYDLEAAQHAKDIIPGKYLDEGIPVRSPIYKRGNQFLTNFTYDGTVSFSYQAGSLTVVKQLTLVHGKNQAALAYTIENTAEETTFVITPHMNYREHSSSSTVSSLVFSQEVIEEEGKKGFLLYPKSAPKGLFIWLGISSGEILSREELFDVDIQLQTEVDNEVAGLDCHYTPYDIALTIPANSKVHFSLLCQVGFEKEEAPIAVSENFAFDAVLSQKNYVTQLLSNAAYQDDAFANALTLATDQFLCQRSSTGLTTVLAGLPWFTDWGRDTMIAFTGLTLSTKRFKEAEEILLTFAKYVHHGMIPNMFPDDGQDPLYNTADASLWYFYAVDQYLTYVRTDEAYAFIWENIYPALKQIIDAYKTGTDFSIYMEEDGLIHAGSGLDQVTWMDVRVGEWVVTPRHGKPVEINALWYNALCVMDKLARRYDDTEVLTGQTTEYATLSKKVQQSFCEKFWNEEKNCLYDVIAGSEKDDSLRPNQIYAVSLPYTMLDSKKAASVVEVVKRELYADCGLRSLSRDHKDYHPIYLGSLPKRDGAYHQGTAWGFLMGGFITAYLKVNHHSKEAVKQALSYLEPMKNHLWENCIGSICEIFDGDAPHLGRGCYAQAWSIGETLRCYTEDILPYL